MHGKISKIKSKKIGILKNLPKTFEATRYHSLIIDKKTLSDSLEITAETEDGLIMGVQHKVYNIHGCLLYTSPSPRDRTRSRMPSSA